MIEKEKVVLIGPVYPYKGGISHYTSLLYRALIKKYEVKLISYKMQYPKFLFKKEQRDYSNDLFKIDEAEFLINTANPFNIISVSHIINKENPKFVIVQWWHPYFSPCYSILLSGLKKSIKVIFTCHNVIPHERFPFDKLLTKMVLKRGDGFIVQSKKDERDLLSIKPNAIEKCTPHPTYNAFKLRDISKKQGVEEIIEKDHFDVNYDTPLLLFFGFVREYKGLKYLLEAMPLVLGKLPDCKLLVVGSFGDDKVDYIELINKYGINDNVLLKDDYTPDNEVEKYFAACDLVVLPYEDATQSGIVQIAFGFEKPCVVTNVGGLPDVVSDHLTGFVVEPRDVQGISKAIIEYFKNDYTEKMHLAIQEEEKRFSWEHMVDVISELL